MSLTPKQEAFCIAYLETSNASESYRRAYECEKMSATSINRAAKDVIDNPKITARLAEMRAPVVEAAQMTVAGHLERLRQLSEKAESEGKYAAAVTAEMARGKVSGFYVEKLDHTSSDGTMSPKGKSLDDFYGGANVPAQSKPA